jgi:hypothetical protein
VDDANPSSVSDGTNRGLVIALVVLAGVIILGFVGCAGIGALRWFLASRAQEEELAQAERAMAEAVAAEQAAGQLAKEDRERSERLGLPPAAERDQAQFQAQTFIEHLQEGEVDAAYNLTSPAFRQKQSPKEFRQWVEEHPGVRRLQPFGMAQPREYREPVLRYRFLAPIRNRVRIEATLVLSRETDEWRIAEVELREDRLP